MELSAEKFENEKYRKYNTTPQKQKFNINEIKAYLENNKNIEEYDTHLLTDINNNFSSSRKNILQQQSTNREENYNENDEENYNDLVMNQNYNYNPMLSLESSNRIQNI